MFLKERQKGEQEMEKYESPEMEVVQFETEDVLATSGTPDTVTAPSLYD